MSVGGTPGGGDCGYSGEGDICNCLECSLGSIEAALLLINQTLNEKLDKSCDHIDECMDRIVDNLRDRFEGPVASCEECKSMLANGLGGTFEFVFACAGVTCGECDTVCSLGDPDSEGKCCKGCGQEKCCCKSGVCEPCPDDEDKEKNWVGWCNRSTGSFIVTKLGDQSPGEGWEQVALAETERQAAEQAAAACHMEEPEPPPPYNPIGINVGSPGILCSLSDYQSGAAFDAIARVAGDANIGAGVAEFQRGLSQLGLGGVNIGNLAQTLVGIVTSQTGLPGLAVADFSEFLAKAAGCNNPQFISATRLLAATAAFNERLGMDTSEWTKQYRYAMNLMCRNGWLGANDATQAHLANVIDYGQANTLWGMNGFCQQAFDINLRSQRRKPIPLELAVMRRREIIDQQGYADGMRQLGFLESDVAENLFKITEQVPTLQDIIRLMVRDADDEAGVVKDFDLDAKFGDKYPAGGQLRKWAEFQGVPEQVARYAWRAHWQIPPPTALFEFYHRLRKNPEYPDMLEDVKKALIQQDILPFWHRHYLAISFRPMGRIDVRRSYNIGALTDDEVKDAYTQLGYSDEVVDSLFKFSKRLRDAGIANSKPVKLWQNGTITRDDAKARLSADGFPDDAIDKALSDSEASFASHPLSKSFVRGELRRENYVARLTQLGVSQDGASRIADKLSLSIRKSAALGDFAVGLVGRAEASSEMTSYGMDTDIAEAILDDAERALRQNFLAQCQRGIKRRFLLGEIDGGDAKRELVNRGTTEDRASRLINWWGCELSANGKAVPAAKLCDWLARGAITPDDLRKRLIRLGYHAAEAALMVEDCLISINAHRLAQAKKQAKEQALESRRSQRALERQIATENRTVAALERQRKQAQTVRSRRERQAMGAAQKIYAKSGVDIYDSLGFVNSQRGRVREQYGLTVDESLIAVVKAVETCKGCQFPELVDFINAMAETAVSEANKLAAELAGD